MFIIGIDPGSSITACGLIDPSSHEILCDYIKFKKSMDHQKKMYEIFLYVKRMLKEYPIKDVALEGSFYSVNVQSAMLLAQIRACVTVAAMDMGFTVYQYLPRQVKQAVCGYGNATKEQIRYIVEKTLNVDLSGYPLDVSDALAIALTHMYSSGGGGKHATGSVYG